MNAHEIEGDLSQRLLKKIASLREKTFLNPIEPETMTEYRLRFSPLSTERLRDQDVKSIFGHAVHILAILTQPDQEIERRMVAMLAWLFSTQNPKQRPRVDAYRRSVFSNLIGSFHSNTAQKKMDRATGYMPYTGMEQTIIAKPIQWITIGLDADSEEYFKRIGFDEKDVEVFRCQVMGCYKQICWKERESGRPFDAEMFVGFIRGKGASVYSDGALLGLLSMVAIPLLCVAAVVEQNQDLPKDSQES